VKNTFQIAADAAVACREAVTAQKAVEEAGRAASLAVEAAKDAAQCIMLQMTSYEVLIRWRRTRKSSCAPAINARGHSQPVLV
jgi:hypothetical protein